MNQPTNELAPRPCSSPRSSQSTTTKKQQQKNNKKQKKQALNEQQHQQQQQGMNIESEKDRTFDVFQFQTDHHGIDYLCLVCLFAFEICVRF